MSIHSLLSNKSYGLKKVLEKLIAHRLDQDVMRVLAHLDHEISDEDFQWIQKSYHSYAVEKQPLEYILGFVEFLGNKFMVDRNTLIPRPETEYMIEAVLKELKASNQKQVTSTNMPDTGYGIPVTLIDVGTGCGVLGLSCILHGADYLDQVYLTEYYPETLEVARRNREKYLETTSIQQQVTSNNLLQGTQLLQCSLLDNPILRQVIGGFSSNQLPATGYSLPVTSCIIVANLPYIPEQLFEDNVEDNVKLREPKPAFVGGEDGLDWYREMLHQIQNVKCKMQNDKQKKMNSPLDLGAPGGYKEGLGEICSSLILFLEMMTRQVEILAREFAEHFSFEEVATFHMNIRIVKTVYIG